MRLVAVRARLDPIRVGWERLSLRSRLLASVLVLVAGGLVVSDVAGAIALRSYLVGRLDQSLAIAVPSVNRLLETGGRADQQQVYSILGDTYAAVVSSSGQVVQNVLLHPLYEVSPSPPQLPRGIGSSKQTLLTAPAVRSGSAGWRLRVEPLPNQGANLVVGASLSGVRSTLSRLELIEILVSLAVLVVIAVVGRWLVHLGLRPLDKIAETAGAIAAGDLSQRVERDDPATEVGRLGLALNAMLGQIEAAFGAREASEERLRRFAADASHELRTPLTSIRGYAELFRRGAWERPDDLRLAMRRIEEEAARMGVLVEDLLLLARLDQRRPLDRCEVDLARIATDAVGDARVTEPNRPIELQLPRGGSVWVLGDEARLRQVVANLLTNTRHHTPPGTPVVVSTWVEEPGAGSGGAGSGGAGAGGAGSGGAGSGGAGAGGAGTSENGARGLRAVLEVADEGPGLAPDQASRVFERFYRADSARSRGTVSGGAGTGLGLSIVAAIAEAHGGNVAVTSLPGKGARFRVELPAIAGSTQLASTLTRVDDRSDRA
jgi:two-component system OmpR family sensor kinase